MSLAVFWLVGAAAASVSTPADSPVVAAFQLPPTVADSTPLAPQQVRAIRLARPVVIDGTLNDPIWQAADRVTGFLQREPNERTQPTESTVVYVAYDDAALYIGARMYDSHPDSIVARLGRRDAQTNSDGLAVYIAPSHHRRSGPSFATDAAGTSPDRPLNNA